jgi:competence protein ComEC
VGVKFYKKAAVGCMAAAVFIFGFLVGTIRTEMFLAAAEARSLAPYIGKGTEVEGRVVDDPDRRDASLRIVVKVERVNGVELPKAGQGKLIAILQRDEQINFNDRVTLKGEVKLPESFETDTGHIFDYPKYLEVRGISALMSFANVEERTPGGFSLTGTLFTLKHKFERALERVFTEPQGALAEGILIGERRGLPEDLSRAFVVSGLVHVVVLSGYNISIVAEWVMRAFAFLPKTLGLASGGVVIVLFALMTGGSATAVRACIMALVAILGRYLERPSDAIRSLIAAVCVMVLWNPLSTLYDPSFILSVLATFGLITISPTVEKKLKWMPEKFGIRSIAASTISVQIYVLPALLYFTGVLSFVSLPANILALPVVSLAMLLSFVAGMLALIHPLLAFVPGIIADLLLRWMIGVAQVATAIPFSSTVVAQFSPWIVALSYIPLTVFAIWLYMRSIKRSAHERGKFPG